MKMMNNVILAGVLLVSGGLLVTVYGCTKQPSIGDLKAEKKLDSIVKKAQDTAHDAIEKMEEAEQALETAKQLEQAVEELQEKVDLEKAEVVADFATDSEELLSIKEPVIKEITKGLTYSIDKEGDASVVATFGKKVAVHYTGYLQNADGSKGKKFDSSVDRGEPFVFPLGAGYVIKGWDMGVEGMLKNEERTLTIAPEFGYGPRGVPGAIPGNATLIFEVKFLDQR